MVYRSTATHRGKGKKAQWIRTFLYLSKKIIRVLNIFNPSFLIRLKKLCLAPLSCRLFGPKVLTGYLPCDTDLSG